MGITREETAKVAELARLSFSSADLDILSSQLDRILHFMQKLDELELGELSLGEYNLPYPSPLREDRPLPSLSADQALANAPRLEGGSLVVPSIIDTDGNEN